MKKSLLEISFMGKLIKRIMIKWLSSSIRKSLLDFRYFHLAIFLKRPPKAHVFLALNDPHSLILIQILPYLIKHFDIEFELHLISESLSDDTLDPKKWRHWSLHDANMLAKHLQLNAIDKLPDQQSLITGQQLWQIQRRTLKDACDIFCQTWYGEFTEHFQSSTPVINSQFKNQSSLISMGHFLPSTIFYCGEWFLGVERLEHFKNKLVQLQLQKSVSAVFGKISSLRMNNFTVVEKDKNKVAFADKAPIIAYISLRSPYSYLGFMQVLKMSKHYNIPLILKPVLPLMMRNLPVSKNKMRYIFLDSIREAKLKKIPFDKFLDPLGQGVINCYQLFSYAQQQNKAEAFMEKMFTAVYVNGIDLTSVNNLQDFCKQLDFDYQVALAFDQNNPWKEWSDKNLSELESLDLWGVPCFVYENTKVWGQDRLWQIEQSINKALN